MLRVSCLVGALLVAVSGCTRQPAASPPTVSATLPDRLFSNLDARRQWEARYVKIALAAPEVATAVRLNDAHAVLVHAWGANQNDFNTPMMRLERSPLFFAITDGELRDLRANR